jgi:hypothetical protein
MSLHTCIEELKKSPGAMSALDRFAHGIWEKVVEYGDRDDKKAEELVLDLTSNFRIETILKEVYPRIHSEMIRSLRMSKGGVFQLPGIVVLPVVKRLEQTCNACPSQWEGETEGGLGIYIRYRWGVLSCTINDERVYHEDHGGQFQGLMDTEEMKRHLKETLNFSLV